MNLIDLILVWLHDRKISTNCNWAYYNEYRELFVDNYLIGRVYCDYIELIPLANDKIYASDPEFFSKLRYYLKNNHNHPNALSIWDNDKL